MSHVSQCAIMAAAYPQCAQAPDVAPPPPGEPIRIAIVSGHLWGHSVLKFPIWGWVSLLDRRRFRLYGYHTSARTDVETARIWRSFDRFVQGPLPIERWCEVIRADVLQLAAVPPHRRARGRNDNGLTKLSHPLAPSGGGLGRGA